MPADGDAITIKIGLLFIGAMSNGDRLGGVHWTCDLLLLEKGNEREEEVKR
jgi:hypothetical protein